MTLSKAVAAGAVLGFILAVSPACGPAKKACNASTCVSGCCDEDGECQLGSAQDACGASGNACMACAGNQFCQAGYCTTPGSSNKDAGTNPDAGTTDAGTTDAGTTDAGTTDAGTTDAGTTDAGTDAGTTPTCRAGNFGNAGALQGTAQANTAATFIAYYGELNTDPMQDVLSIQLYAGYGVFTGDAGVRPGTYTLSGDETNFATCGACVQIFADVNPDGGAGGERYMATGGTLTLTSTQGTLTGSLSNANLVEVTVDPNTFVSTPVPNGCTSSISSASFTAPIQVQ